MSSELPEPDSEAACARRPGPSTAAALGSCARRPTAAPRAPGRVQPAASATMGRGPPGGEGRPPPLDDGFGMR
jgi:hypothetical protein